MMENNDQLFDDYLHDRLEEGRLKEFEERLGSDEDFRKEFKAHKLVLAALFMQRDRQLLSKMAGQPERLATGNLMRMKRMSKRPSGPPESAVHRSKKARKIIFKSAPEKEKPSPAEENGKKGKWLRPIHYWSIAASVLLIAAVIWLNPFGSEEVLISKGKIRKVPVLVTTEALGFSSTVDSLDVQVNRIKGAPRYEFFDVLKLYLPERLSGVKIRVTYFESSRRYELTLEGKKFRINKFGSGRLK